MIRVVNQRKHVKTPKDVYVGRPSPLANKWSSKPSAFPDVKRVPNAHIAVAYYKEWLLHAIRAKDAAVIAALRAIPSDANLVCWCVNEYGEGICHGQVIKALKEQGELEIMCSEGNCYGRGRWTEDGGVQITCFACNGTGKIVEKIDKEEIN